MKTSPRAAQVQQAYVSTACCFLLQYQFMYFSIFGPGWALNFFATTRLCLTLRSLLKLRMEWSFLKTDFLIFWPLQVHLKRNRGCKYIQANWKVPCSVRACLQYRSIIKAHRNTKQKFKYGNQGSNMKWCRQIFSQWRILDIQESLDVSAYVGNIIFLVFGEKKILQLF